MYEYKGIRHTLAILAKNLDHLHIFTNNCDKLLSCYRIQTLMLSIERDKGEQGSISDLKNHLLVQTAMHMNNLINERGTE